MSRPSQSHPDKALFKQLQDTGALSRLEDDITSDLFLEFRSSTDTDAVLDIHRQARAVALIFTAMRNRIV